MRFEDLNELDNLINKLEQQGKDLEKLENNSKITCHEARAYAILNHMNTKKLEQLKRERNEYINWYSQTVGAPTHER